MKRETDVTRRILQSQNGKRIIDFVAPIYNEGETALWLFESIGRILDDISENIDSLRQQVTPETATWTLPYWENEYNIIPESYWNEQERRASIIAKIKYIAPVNPAKIEQFASAAMGVPCKVIENISKNTFRLVIDGWSASFPRVKQIINEAKPAHLIWNVYARIPIMIIKESFGSMFEKDLRFQTFFNYWNCYCFDGRRQFDGSLLFNQRRGGLSLAQTNVKINAVMPHRVYPEKFSFSVLAFRTDEKVFAILDCGRTVFDNMGEFIRLNGDKTLDGSWQLWQRARSAIYKDFQITETVREKKKLFAVATVITVVQHTPILFQKVKLETSVLPFAPTKERLEHRIVFLSKAKETVSSDIRELFFSGFSMKNKESVSIIEKYFHRFQEKKDFLSRQLSIFIPLAEPSGSGNAELFAGIFEVLNVTETLGFYQNWRVINRNLSPVLLPVSVETNEKIFNDTAIQNIKNVTFSPYSICNNSTFDVKVAITTVRPSRADGTYRLDGTLRFDGKALPQTETL